MRTSKFKKPLFTNKANRKKRNGDVFTGWKLVDLSKEERMGKTQEQIDDLRKQKYSEQVKKMKELSETACVNNMTLYYNKALKAKQRRESRK
jgi:hypothetical protein